MEFVVVIIVLLILSFAVVPRMANSRGRNSCGWIFFSLIISPIIVIIILAVLGETEERRINRIIEEEKLRESIRSGGIIRDEYREEAIIQKKSEDLPKTLETNQIETTSIREEDSRHNHVASKMVLIIGLVIVSLLALYGLWMIIYPNNAEEEKRNSTQNVVKQDSTNIETQKNTAISDELKEFVSKLNIRDFFHPKNKETEMFVISKDSKFKSIYSIVREEGNYNTVNRAGLYQNGLQWSVTNDTYITYSIKNKEITQIKSTEENVLFGGTQTDSDSKLILKLPTNNDSINWEYTTTIGKEKQKYNYFAQLKYFKVKKVRGSFIQIPVIELTKKCDYINSDSGEWKHAPTYIEYWGKGLGLLLVILPNSNNSVSEFNSEIEPSTYQIIDFEKGYKEEKGIK